MKLKQVEFPITLATTNEIIHNYHQEYLKSNHWKKIKQLAKEEFKHECYICRSNPNHLALHHKSYERLGAEILQKDLIYVCDPCHSFIHLYLDKYESEGDLTLENVADVVKTLFDNRKLRNPNFKKIKMLLNDKPITPPKRITKEDLAKEKEMKERLLNLKGLTKNERKAIGRGFFSPRLLKRLEEEGIS